ncbi:acyl-CoA dehydrogenase family protein [Burkholderia multivorans]|uniref:acyl-CoA dehydrogenase family protein n=1 Tax=Burkholderia multivorans TaxID=87883 RepID=UPI00075DE66F|nr:acyl-CoA dehydrogenase family protein [Burkholderia multivorans]KVR40957.1 acyl-CoA dehydrogenase [Burkholderia multivorans]
MTPQVESFARQARKFVDAHIAPEIDAWEAAGAYPLALAERAGAAGLLSLGGPSARVPRDPHAIAALIRELARCGSHGVAVGLTAHLVSLAALAGGPADLLAELAPTILEGRATIALAVTEPSTGSDLSAIETTARATSDGYTISGVKSFVCNGSRADWLVVFAREEASAGLFLVDGRDRGMTSEAMACVGWRSIPLANLRFDNVAARRLTNPGAGKRMLAEMLLQERLNLAVLASASTDLALSVTVAHCKRRCVGGAPLFQKSAVRQRLAERYVEAFCARTVVDDAVERHASGQLDASGAALAKNAAVDVLARIADEAVQLHGAIGCIVPSLVERIWRDARILSIGGGAREVMLEIIARKL